MMEEVKQSIIKLLCMFLNYRAPEMNIHLTGDAGARLSKLKDKYTLPWTSLEQNLKEWQIDMINWPEDVKRTDSIKGIHGLTDKEVKILWDAIHATDPEKKLQFRRTGSTGDSRKRRADALDGDDSEGQSRASKSLRVNENGFPFIIWNP